MPNDGIQDYGPEGFDNPGTAKVTKVGFVGSAGSLRGVHDWMVVAKGGVAETASKKPGFVLGFLAMVFVLVLFVVIVVHLLFSKRAPDVSRLCLRS